MNIGKQIKPNSYLMKDKNQNHAYCSTIGFIPMSLTLHSSDMPLSKYNKIVLKKTNIYKNIKTKAYMKKDKIQKHTYTYNTTRTFPANSLLHSNDDPLLDFNKIVLSLPISSILYNLCFLPRKKKKGKQKNT